MGICFAKSQIPVSLETAGECRFGSLAIAPRRFHPALALLTPPAMSADAAQQMRGQLAALNPSRLSGQQCAQHVLIQRAMHVADEEQLQRVFPDIVWMSELVEHYWFTSGTRFELSSCQELPRKTLNQLVNVRAVAQLAIDGVREGILPESLVKGLLEPQFALSSASEIIDALAEHFIALYTHLCDDTATSSLFCRAFSVGKAGTPRISIHTDFLAITFSHLFDGVDKTTANCVRSRLASIDSYLRPLGLPDFLVDWTEPMDEEYFYEVDQLTTWFSQQGIEPSGYEAHFDTATSECGAQWISEYGEFQFFEYRRAATISIAKQWKEHRAFTALPLRKRRSKKARELLAWCEQVDQITAPYRERNVGPIPANNFALMNIIILPELVEFEDQIQMLFESHMNGDEDECLNLLDGLQLHESAELVKRLALGEKLIKSLLEIDGKEY